MATEKRWIDVLEFAKRCDRLLENPLHIHPGTSWQRGIDMAVAEAFLTRPVDAVEVVRCKDCKHYDNSEGIQWCHLNSKFAQWGTDWHSFPEDGFCSYGERREGE